MRVRRPSVAIRLEIEAAFAREEGDVGPPISGRSTSIKTWEWERINEVLAETGFNVSETARRLGMRIGLISDTHNLLRPEALAFLAGSDHIVHGGDICDPAILAALAAIAPVSAVRGNNDRGEWAERLCESELVQAGEVAPTAEQVAARADVARDDIDRSLYVGRRFVHDEAQRPSMITVWPEARNCSYRST